MPIKDKFREVTFQKFDANTHLFTVLLHEEKELGVFHENCILNLELCSEIKKILSESKDFPIFAYYYEKNPYISVSNSDNSLNYNKFWVAVHEVGHALMVLHHGDCLHGVEINENGGMCHREKPETLSINELDIHVAGDAATALFGYAEAQASPNPEGDELKFHRDAQILNVSEFYSNFRDRVMFDILNPLKPQIFLLSVELLRSYRISGEDFERMCKDFNAIPKVGAT